jgi:hypothetical protein
MSCFFNQPNWRPHWRVLCLALGLWASAISGESLHAETPQSANLDRGVALEKVISLLETSPTGRSLIQKAFQAWDLKTRQDFQSRLKWGSASRTDAVLIRHYDAETGKESRERKVSIYLRREQPLSDLMLDLAHELVHATARPSWDPYDPGLTAGAYIHAAIEGEGGEVDAVHAECRVSSEVFGQNSKSASASRCQKYSSTHAVENIRKDFYRVGHWITELRRNLGSENHLFPLLSDEKPALYSSTGGAPYPVALYEEYQQMTSVACENTRRRAPASVSSSESGLSGLGDEADKSMRLFLQRRCKN